MRAMYLKGEKVYVERINFLPDGRERRSLFDDKIQIIKQAEIIRAFNCLFQYVEENPDEIGDDLHRILYDINLLSKHDNHKIHVDIADRETTYFDDPRKVKLVQRARQARLKQEMTVQFDHKLKLVKGGICAVTESTPAPRTAGRIIERISVIPTRGTRGSGSARGCMTANWRKSGRDTGAGLGSGPGGAPPLSGLMCSPSSG